MKKTNSKPKEFGLPIPHYKVIEAETPKELEDEMHKAWCEGYFLWEFNILEDDEGFIYFAIMKALNAPKPEEAQRYDELRNKNALRLKG